MAILIVAFAAAIIPLNTEPALKVAISVMPHSETMRYSAGPRARMMGRTNGMQAARKTAPMMPPSSTAVAEAPSARSPSPRTVIG